MRTEGVERAVVGTLEGIEETEALGEGIDAPGVPVEGLAEIFGIGIVLYFRKKRGVDAVVAAQVPIGVNEGIDEVGFDRTGGFEPGVVLLDEAAEFFDVFAGSDQRFGSAHNFRPEE